MEFKRQEWEIICANNVSNKGSITRIYREILRLDNKNTFSFIRRLLQIAIYNEI